MDEAERIREVVQAQIIACLNRFYAIETGMWGGPLDALIVRTVVVGKMEGRLFDLSALSNTLDLPVSTLHRKVRDLEIAGYLTRERKGRSTFLLPTDRTCVQLDQSFEEMISTLRRLYRGGRMLAESPVVCMKGDLPSDPSQPKPVKDRGALHPDARQQLHHHR